MERKRNCEKPGFRRRQKWPLNIKRILGKLKDDLSKDVKIKDKKCATKDSVAKHDDSMHMQLPGTIQFQNNPKKDGKVSGGTSSKVKINGKEAAVKW